MKDSLKIAVAGATGYVGLELIKLLTKHPKAKIVYLCAQGSIGKSVHLFDKKINKKNLPMISNINNIDWNKINTIFAALPNGEAQKIAKRKPDNVRLIDLSADFRLKNTNLYKKWYGIDHKSKKHVKNSIYAITEFTRDKLYKYNIIACPGCYPTSIQLPLIPLIKNKMINVDNIVIDSKSGYSGAGKNLRKKFPIQNLFQSVAAYGVGSHRHMPEIDQEISNASARKIKVFFTPHLIPMYRGILSTLYLDLNKRITPKKIWNFLRIYHKKNFFVKIEKFNKSIGTGEVINTNFCKISVFKGRKKNKVIIVSVIDNLIKGASGQAVQNMNAAYGFRETAGLI